MGNETQLIIGEDTGQYYPATGTFFMDAALIDMYKMGNSSILELPRKNDTPDKKRWSWYAPTGDGDTPVMEDRYGDIPQPVPIGDVIESLKTDVATGAGYRRFKWALALLQAMEATQGDREFKVLVYGY